MSYIYALHDNKEKRQELKNGAFPISKDKAQELNKQGYGIFYSVNEFHSPERRDSNLKRLKSWFVDMDSGSKDSQSSLILSFPIEPSAVVETKNGHHLYWKCKEDYISINGLDSAVKEYNHILSGLVAYFDGDKNAKGATRILRVPDFLHMKDEANPYKIKIVHDSQNEYTSSEMLASLPIKEKKPIVVKTEQKQLDNDDFWQKVSKFNCIDGLECLSGASELKGDVISFRDNGQNKKAIYVNGELSSCWIDKDGMIGSFDSGGPNIAKWINWYGIDWPEVANIIKKYIPELKPKEIDFNWF